MLVYLQPYAAVQMLIYPQPHAAVQKPPQAGPGLPHKHSEGPLAT